MKNKLNTISFFSNGVSYSYRVRGNAAKNFTDGGNDIKIRWTSGKLDYQVISNNYYVNEIPGAVNPWGGIKLRFLDKDGFEVLNNGPCENNYTTEKVGNVQKKVWRGDISCSGSVYKKNIFRQS